MRLFSRLLGIAFAIFCFIRIAAAGDYADRDIIGFSPDGSYFAFEEFSVQDGSGFPYSNFFVIDTKADSWVAGTPIRVRIDDETATLTKARGDARAKAKPVLAKLDIASRGTLVVSNPATELSADPYAVRFRTNPYFNMTERAWNLKLTTLPFPDAASCENLGPVKGFRLALTDPEGKVRVLKEDTAIPESRFCPRDHAISDVITLTPQGDEATIVVLVSLFRQGFEVPDRRFLAVAARYAER